VCSVSIIPLSPMSPFPVGYTMESNYVLIIIYDDIQNISSIIESNSFILNQLESL